MSYVRLEALAELRKQAHWSLNDLSFASGIKPATLYQLEYRLCNPKSDTLLDLAETLAARLGLRVGEVLAKLHPDILRM
jgi:transcriptional regulator with XRE-family HTH domain